MPTDESFKGFNTRAVQIGDLRDPRFGNISTPIFESSTFIYPNYDENAYIDHSWGKPYIYTRWGNPTIEALEKKYAGIELSEKALSFSSGMGAITATILSSVEKGDKILSIKELYGQTYAFFTEILPKWGIEVDFITMKEMNSLETLDKKYKLLYTESITNPTLQVSNLPEISKLCKESDVKLMVDATFASPYNQNPLDIGADIVAHSGTKYLSGHSDVILGLVGLNESDFDRTVFMRKSLGSTPDPLQAFLAIRGLKTLGLRMEKHNKNGMSVAKFLEQNGKIKKVYYPGLQNFEHYDIAQKVLKGFGGMVSFELKGGLDEARKFLKGLKIAALAPSLGGVESLVTLPIDTSHSTVSAEARKEMNVSDGLVRFSAGIEDEEDLIEDLQEAISLL